MFTGELPLQLKLVLSRNIGSELWGFDELSNLINTEVKSRASCGEYNGNSRGSESDHLELWSTSALASQANKSNSIKCVYCLLQHLLDKCNV